MTPDGELFGRGISLLKSNETKRIYEIQRPDVVKKHLKDREELSGWFSILNDKLHYYRGNFLEDGIYGEILWLRYGVGFLLDRQKLILVPGENTPKAVLAGLKQFLREKEGMENMDSVQLFLQLLSEILSGDEGILQRIERLCYNLDDKVLLDDEDDVRGKLLGDRRVLLEKSFHYRQMNGFCQILWEQPTSFFQEEEIAYLQAIYNRAEKLGEYSSMLWQYVSQLMDIYKNRLEEKQNHTMKMLTIVTTLFFPLTLITGWYGMNFKYMPELNLPYGYVALIVICIIIIGLEIGCFKRKNIF